MSPISFDQMVTIHLKKALAMTGGKIYGKGGAAEILGMKPTTLQSKAIGGKEYTRLRRIFIRIQGGLFYA
ncbi:hypothetical protein [Desulfosarcina ovata]|uniref:DNA binding HTH domain-containing protein n=1 Tax=Desulfosarcina ovata subsp. ovata TaxID=2752305 RepID=A0A5K8ADB2_9BACT|nr:hypothetical protein [Desulfosarcina ovata]BBO90539.1 hypothetical protein DSCOOX_37190 [Desulfosarcina ovata subsp. ovata]